MKIAIWAFVATALMVAFLHTPLGRMCNAVRDNPERAEFIGYDPVRVRFVAFSIAADLVRPVRTTLIEGPRDRSDIVFGDLQRDVPVDPATMRAPD